MRFSSLACLLVCVSCRGFSSTFGVPSAGIHESVNATSWSCTDAQDCTSCYNSSSWCHWCDEGGCHARGDVVRGCAVGFACDAHSSVCQKQASCKECYEHLACHWCPETMACHSWGSVYGCSVGASCYTRSSCVRGEPEWIGYAQPPSVLWVFFGFTLASIICCFVCWLSTCYHSYQAIKACRGAATERQRDIQLATATDVGLIQVEAQDSRLARSRLALAPMRLLESCIWRGYWPSLACCVLLILLLTFSGVFLVLFSPHYPLSSICYNGVDWNVVVKDVASFYSSRYYANFELLLSLYNPNRVDLNLTSMRGIVHFPASQGGTTQEVGTITLGDFVAKAGCVTDTIGTLSFNMDRWSGLDMGGAYEAGHLEIGIDLSLAFEVSAHRMPLSWASTMQLDRMIVNVNDPVDYTYCRCKN